MVTHKDGVHQCAKIKAVGTALFFTLKLGHLYVEYKNEQTHYKTNTVYLFFMAELAQVHQNLGHAPTRYV